MVLLILASAGFLLTASAINRLTCILAPVALALIFFYSVTKRFTSATHFFLGLALAIAPVGAWIAQTGTIDLAPLVLAAGVICWVAGFDLIYATQDYDFDRREGIRSLVVKLGITRSLRLAQLLHLLTFVALIAFGFVAKLGALYYWSLPLIAAALVYEHRTEKRDLAGINRAFFQSNAFVSAVFLLAVCVDRLIEVGAIDLNRPGGSVNRRYLTSRLTSRRVVRAGRHRKQSQAKSAQFLAPGLRESYVHPSRARSHHCDAARAGPTLRSSKARNARRAPCSLPSLHHCLNRRRQCRGRTRRALLLLLQDE